MRRGNSTRLSSASSLNAIVGPIGQAVVDRKCDDEVIGGDRPDCKRTDLVVEAGESEVDLAVANGGERLRAVHFGERQRKRRILAARGAQHVRHDVEQRQLIAPKAIPAPRPWRTSMTVASSR